MNLQILQEALKKKLSIIQQVEEQNRINKVNGDRSNDANGLN